MRTQLLIIAALLAPPMAQSEPTHVSSGPERARLVELYTSEGCHSCPSADAWLSKLKNDDRLWDSVVPVAFHVDYWDYIGWKDRFASPDFTRRQRKHAEVGNVRSVYTPGFVVAGAEWREWFQRQPLPAPSGQPGKLNATIDGTRVQITFESDDATPGPLQVSVARLVFEQETEVSAGENYGKTLHHDFVVSSFKRVDMKQAGETGTWSGTLALAHARHESTREAIAVWVTPRDGQYALQAAGGFISQ
ncbi:MAG: DUF1223 domain-containing protein [Chromatiales bacterium]|nr:DUF1223 domain-containing protein [Chromatiales bacterium]